MVSLELFNYESNVLVRLTYYYSRFQGEDLAVRKKETRMKWLSNLTRLRAFKEKTEDCPGNSRKNRCKFPLLHPAVNFTRARATGQLLELDVNNVFASFGFPLLTS